MRTFFFFKSSSDSVLCCLTYFIALCRVQRGGYSFYKKTVSTQYNVLNHFWATGHPSGGKVGASLSEFAKAPFSWHILHFHLYLEDFRSSFNTEHKCTFSVEPLQMTIAEVNIFFLFSQYYALCSVFLFFSSSYFL